MIIIGLKGSENAMLSACMALIDGKTEKEEFERFYRKNRRLAMGKAFAILHDKALAEDALSEAFLRLAKCFQKVHNLPSHKLLSYFVIIVRNVSLDMIKKDTVQEYIIFDDELEYPDTALPSAEHERLTECIEKLSDTDREILYLRYDLELEYGDIAAALSITEAAARQRAMYARNKLKALLEKE